jgi:hypothetical protein
MVWLKTVVLGNSIAPLRAPLSSNVQFTPFGFGSISPEITVVSPENRIYNSSSLSLIFTVDKSALWMGYSLDGQETVAVAGSTTVTGLTNGVHNVAVYAKDAFENTRARRNNLF